MYSIGLQRFRDSNNRDFGKNSIVLAKIHCIKLSSEKIKIYVLQPNYQFCVKVSLSLSKLSLQFQGWLEDSHNKQHNYSKVEILTSFCSYKHESLKVKNYIMFITFLQISRSQSWLTFYKSTKNCIYKSILFIIVSIAIKLRAIFSLKNLFNNWTPI